ncbi:hypothetical protein BZL30_7909 [Mycobacterium kansasii]|uniref:Uncharacterized protein n=1 Tax=Mycobacterium kansasii TaxID=1768 RepID=A0A1V3WLC9_MYCKA|nr:hypothetical protein BZL30_7909 [Mycobacterium kansasii]
MSGKECHRITAIARASRNAFSAFFRGSNCSPSVIRSSLSSRFGLGAAAPDNDNWRIALLSGGCASGKFTSRASRMCCYSPSFTRLRTGDGIEVADAPVRGR